MMNCVCPLKQMCKIHVVIHGFKTAGGPDENNLFDLCNRKVIDERGIFVCCVGAFGIFWQEEPQWKKKIHCRMCLAF